MRDEQLLAYLKGSCSGRKNRVGGTELERTLHVSGTDLRKLVNQLRRKTQDGITSFSFPVSAGDTAHSRCR